MRDNLERFRYFVMTDMTGFAPEDQVGAVWNSGCPTSGFSLSASSLAHEICDRIREEANPCVILCKNLKVLVETIYELEALNMRCLPVAAGRDKGPSVDRE